MKTNLDKPDLEETYDFDKKDGRKKRLIVTVICLLVVVTLALISAALVNKYVVTTFTVNGISMYPTLDGGNGAYPDNDDKNGEVLYLNMVKDVKRGDIVVFSPEWSEIDKVLVKRVIALGGDRIQIINNKLYLNGELREESYINGPMDTPDIDVTLPSGYMFCMGDNRNHSSDCRIYGPVKTDTVIGTCFLIKGIDGKLRSA